MKKRLDKLKKAIIVSALVVANILVFINMGPATLAPWLLLAGLLALPLLFKGGTAYQEFMVWKDEYSVGVEAFDNEHKRLLNLINNLKTAVLYDTGEEFERHNLNELIAYTREHLKTEEELMEEYDYPDYEGHKAQHDQMIGYVEDFVRKYEEIGRDILPEVADYLTLWLTQHINITDKKYTAFFHECGIK